MHGIYMEYTWECSRKWSNWLYKMHKNNMIQKQKESRNTFHLVWNDMKWCEFMKCYRRATNCLVYTSITLHTYISYNSMIAQYNQLFKQRSINGETVAKVLLVFWDRCYIFSATHWNDVMHPSYYITCAWIRYKLEIASVFELCYLVN